jgi:hypothetical protein
MKGSRISTGSKLTEYTTGYAEFVFDYKVGHIVWQPSVVTGSRLHP